MCGFISQAYSANWLTDRLINWFRYRIIVASLLG
jgi:hypothetical protein